MYANSCQQTGLCAQPYYLFVSPPLEVGVRSLVKGETEGDLHGREAYSELLATSGLAILLWALDVHYPHQAGVRHALESSASRSLESPIVSSRQTRQTRNGHRAPHLLASPIAENTW